MTSPTIGDEYDYRFDFMDEAYRLVDRAIALAQEAWPGVYGLQGLLYRVEEVLQPHREAQKRGIYIKARIPQGLRMRVYERDGFKCLDCGAQKDLSLDHITPEVKGGPSTLENLRTLCRPCNQRKGWRR